MSPLAEVFSLFMHYYLQNCTTKWMMNCQTLCKGASRIQHMTPPARRLRLSRDAKVRWKKTRTAAMTTTTVTVTFAPAGGTLFARHTVTAEALRENPGNQSAYSWRFSGPLAR